MNNTFGHHYLDNRYHFDGILLPMGPIAVSSGRASDDADAAFMRDLAGNIYIPGSSLRGAIRSELERIISSVGANAGLISCILFEKNSCADKARDFMRELPDDNAKRDEKIMEYARDTLCDVCKLFGSTIYASHLIMEDAPLLGAAATDPPLRVRDGVGIDRDTGAARDGAKFNFQVLEPGANGPNFRFRMTIENMSPTDRKLVNLLLKLFQRGVCVGGKRAAGMGKIRLMKGYSVTGFESPDAFWENLSTGANAEATIDWREDAIC